MPALLAVDSARSPLTLPVQRCDPTGWRTAIERALADPSAIRMVFQPIVDLVEGSVVGYEALARFTGPPQAGPDAWFAAADKLGAGADLEARAIHAALAARRDLPENCFLTVNVSPHLLTSPATWTALTADRLDGVVVEFTEHTAYDDLDALAARCADLRERGAVVALDDAGAGYSGLRQLAELRPGLVKLDRSMVQGIERDPVKLALADLLGTYASRLDAWLLAEGIERREELDVFVGLGVPLGQGYLFARPQPHFAGIAPDLSAHIRHRARRRTGGTVETLIEPAPAGASDTALTRFETDIAVIVDGRRRPTQLLTMDAATGEPRRVPVSLTTLPWTAVSDVVQAALSRPAPRRFDPVVCTDGTGRYLGVLRLERLITSTLSELTRRRAR